ncbi:hypothetical protein EB796_021308 [Bugula neritina]|uniref:Uncharacterized protein n=1 Tax=Bugula neritina TaxID=10212 RepID=A0A7J7J3V7_BUGNE|nr:hypothetical protein EB796_021308 [Bugula neritina]
MNDKLTNYKHSLLCSHQLSRAYWIFQFEICKNDIDSFSWVLLEDFKTWFSFQVYIKLKHEIYHNKPSNCILCGLINLT